MCTLAHGQYVRGVAVASDLSFIASAGGRTSSSVIIHWPAPIGSEPTFVPIPNDDERIRADAHRLDQLLGMGGLEAGAAGASRSVTKQKTRRLSTWF